MSLVGPYCSINAQHATNIGSSAQRELELVPFIKVHCSSLGAGVFSLYGHMKERAVEVGQAVTHGQVLGHVGSTGLSTGAHLHWEMSVSGVLVDGLRWVDGSQGF